MVLSTFWFACMGTLAHDVGQTLAWQLTAMVRSAVPFALVLLLALVAGARLVVIRPPVLWLRSIAGSVSLVATFFALTRLPTAEVFTITNTFPIWIALLSWPVNREAPGGVVWLSALTACAGVWIIQDQPHFEDNWVIWVALAASFSTAIAMMGLNRLKDVDTRAIVIHFSAGSLAFALGAFVLFDHGAPLTAPAAPMLLELAGIGVAATVGQLLLTKAFTQGDPAKVAVLGPTQVVWAVALDALVRAWP
jgi:drug/metabolite transporter (DMT)-like permease